MKKLLAALLVLAMMLMGVAALAEGDGYELALVTDVGNIDDQSFNQSSYEGMVAYAEENGLTYAYYRPSRVGWRGADHLPGRGLHRAGHRA